MNKRIYKFCYRSGLISFLATMAFFIAQVLQLWGILTFPWDEILIYGFSLCITLPLLLQMLELIHVVSIEKKYWTHAALIFTVIYVVFVTANY